MIEIKNLETGMTYTDFVQGIEPKVSTWLICTNPSKEELRTIQRTFGIPWEDLEDSMDDDERPRFENEPDLDPPFIKLVVRVPTKKILEHKLDDPIEAISTTAPAVVFLLPNHLVTIQRQILPSKKVKRPIGSRRKRASRTILVLLDWLENVVKAFELAVDTIDQKLSVIEREIFRSVKTQSVSEVFRLSRDATYLDAALRGNLRAFYQLQKVKQFSEKPELLDDLEDLSIDLQQQADLLRIYLHLIESSLDAYASVISNNQNDLIKVLTSISLILMVPTLLASLYGMNVKLPFVAAENDPFAFWLVLIISVIFIIPVWYYLKKTNLL
ncbi:MAG: magnesium transporter CorA family protein [Candidatus Hodarchaeales archaeon]